MEGLKFLALFFCFFGPAWPPTSRYPKKGTITLTTCHNYVIFGGWEVGSTASGGLYQVLGLEHYCAY